MKNRIAPGQKRTRRNCGLAGSYSKSDVSSVYISGDRMPGDSSLQPKFAELIQEALRSQLFSSQWHSPTDETFHAFAAAVLTLTRANTLPLAERLALFQQIAMAKRHTLLGQVAELPVRPSAIKLLSRTAWRGFNNKDWHRLLVATNEPSTAKALGHVTLIKPSLVRQLAEIPELMRLPRIFDVASKLRLSAKLWRKAGAAIEAASPSDKMVLAKAAKKIDSIGALWDFIYLCIEGVTISFEAAQMAKGSTLLTPLTTDTEMLSEGHAMLNCLPQLVGRAWSGLSIYLRSTQTPPATCELVNSAQGWLPGRVLGVANTELDASQAAPLMAELELIAARLNRYDKPMKLLECDEFVATAAAEGRKHFSQNQITAVAYALHEIQGKSLGPTDSAFVVLSPARGGYIQFMSRPAMGEYICEIGGHKFTPHLQNYLTEATTQFITRSGFWWPRKKQNFTRYFPEGDGAFCLVLAAFSLEALRVVYGYASNDHLNFDGQIPG